MTRTKLLLDCDPGLELVAVTTVGGNVDLASTTSSARALREHLGFVDVPIAAGVADPLMRTAENAAHVHGEAGLGNLRLPAPTIPASDRHAVHDVCAVADIARPELFRSRPARVEVETRGQFTSGMTVVDFAARAPNAIVPVELDVAGFWDYVHDAWQLTADGHAND
ncbi:inosine-uridine nucleoside N-ribohydrolase [Marisediminicola sp. UYEF4]|uniref:nucleoside hydrolase n=1 Tax=Marisediminicola sp. UYEF4 TaxID=1756384 RepID=UPI003395BCF8